MRKVAIGFAAITVLAYGAANAVTIDTFQSGSVDFTVYGPVGNVGDVLNTGLPSTETIGGTRYVEANIIQADDGTDDKVEVRRLSGSGAGLFDVANTVGSDSVVTVVWDRNGAGLGGIDLTTNANGLYISFPSKINNALKLTFTITNTTEQTRTGIFNFPDKFAGLNDFLSFTDFGGTGTFTSTSAITMEMNSSAGWDARLDLIDTRNEVPIPGTLLLMGIGLGALLRRIRPDWGWMGRLA